MVQTPVSPSRPGYGIARQRGRASSLRTFPWTLVAVLSLFPLVLSPSFSDQQEGFHKQRQKLREEIKRTRETKIGGIKGLASILFDSDKGRVSFVITPAEERRLIEELRKHLGIEEEDLLSRTLQGLRSWEILVYRSYSSEYQHATFKAAFLAPCLPYQDYILNLRGIEEVFHAYNACVVLGPNKEAPGNVAYMQTEGTLLGITKQVNFPLLFTLDREGKSHSFVEPSQDVVIRSIEALPALNPARTSLKDKFIDYCRLHPFFAERDQQGALVVSEDEILKILDEIALKKEQECDMRALHGEFRVHEPYGDFVLVTYRFHSVVNLDKLLPDLPLVRPMGAKLAQLIADEASGKYIPLSMKNLRDFGIAVAEGRLSPAPFTEDR